MTDRYDVDAIDGTYRVLWAGLVVATVHRRPEAFAFVRDRGARVRLHWERTVIGGRSVSHDFCASHGPCMAGRIMPLTSGTERGRWAWVVNGTDPDTGRGGSTSGKAETKDQAVAELEAAYTEFIANADKYGARDHG